MAVSPDPNAYVIPSTPDPSYVALVAALIRAIAQLLSGAGLLASVTGILQNGSLVTGIASAVVMIVTIIWSLYDKIRTDAAMHTVAVTSAKMGRPLKMAHGTIFQFKRA